MGIEDLTDRMELHFTPTNGPADIAIDRLMTMVGGIQQPGLVRELILAALKAGQENDEKTDLKLMNTSLKEMRFTAKIFGPYRHIRKVSVFGSARTASETQAFRMARDLGRQLADRGYMVITGGGPGIMQAVNEGAGAEHSFGINIRLPFEQKPNPVVEGNPRHINYKYFFNRKVAFLKEADAVVVFPGGFGTLDELFETLTLIQTRKIKPIPVVLVGLKFWRRAFNVEFLIEEGVIEGEDRELFWYAETADEIWNGILAWHDANGTPCWTPGRTGRENPDETVLSWRRSQRDRFLSPCRMRRLSHPGRLRHVPGRARTARRKFGGFRLRSAKHRLPAADPCASRSLRANSAAGQTRVPR